MEEDSEKKDADKKNSMSNINGIYTVNVPKFILDTQRDGIYFHPDVFDKYFTQQPNGKYQFQINIDDFFSTRGRIRDPLNETKCLVGFKSGENQCAISQSEERLDNYVSNIITINDVTQDINAIAIWSTGVVECYFAEKGTNGYSFPVEWSYTIDNPSRIHVGDRFGDIFYDDPYYTLDTADNDPIFELLGFTMNDSSTMLDPEHVFTMKDLENNIVDPIAFGQYWNNIGYIQCTYIFDTGSRKDVYVKGGEKLAKSNILRFDPNDFTKRSKTYRYNNSVINIDDFIAPKSNFTLNVDTQQIVTVGMYDFKPQQKDTPPVYVDFGYYPGSFGDLNPKTFAGHNITNFSSSRQGVYYTIFDARLYINTTNAPYKNIYIMYENGWVVPYGWRMGIDKSYNALGVIDLKDFGYVPREGDNQDLNIKYAIINSADYNRGAFDFPIDESIGDYTGKIKFEYYRHDDPDYGDDEIFGYSQHLNFHEINREFGKLYNPEKKCFGGTIKSLIGRNLVISNMTSVKEKLYVTIGGIAGPTLYVLESTTDGDSKYTVKYGSGPDTLLFQVWFGYSDYGSEEKDLDVAIWEAKDVR